MDRATRAEIQRFAATTLRDAGLTEPPLSVERLLEHVQLHCDYYDLSNPEFLIARNISFGYTNGRANGLAVRSQLVVP
jgi:hypothetical protein